MTSLRILIIDNNAEDRLMMNRALADFIVNEAPTADEGIEAAQQTNPDCILLSFGLPEIDGFAILEHLIPEPTSPKVAVVMLMGADDEKIANVAIKRALRIV
jgi:CheY-like chemotaxis protein